MIDNKSKKEIFDGVQKIINESLGGQSEVSATKCNKSFFGLNKKINSLCEQCSTNKALIEFVDQYSKALSEGYSEVLLIESFLDGLKPFEGNSKVKALRKSLINAVNENRKKLQVAFLFESMDDDGLKTVLEKSYNDYIDGKDTEGFKTMVESFTHIGNAVMDNLGKVLGCDSTNGCDGHIFGEPREEETRANIDTDSLKEKITDFITAKFNEMDNAKAEKPVEESSSLGLSDIANNNGINLFETVCSIKAATENAKLHAILDEYYNALTNGAYEERLYETFFSNVSNYSYLTPVETELSSLNKRVNAAKQDIDLTKILEMMLATTSYYIVPLIEEQVAEYIKDKTPNKKAALIFGLKPHGHDPYVKQILEIVSLDQDRKANVVEESVLTKKDQTKLVLEQASVNSLYSPVQYIKENESIFNIKGTFYQKKGNVISRLPQNSLDSLNETFLELCKLVNDPRVSINDDAITFTSNNKSAYITEGCAVVNGNRETSVTLRDLNEMFMKYQDYDTEFFIMTTCLLEHFNDIAKIDFAKRVSLNEDTDCYLDLFNLNSNLYVTTHNELAHQHIFYKNVNPIQCKNIINEHMGLNVSALFENILPNQASLLENINDTKSTYEDKIEELKAMKDKLEAKYKECTDKDDKDKLKSAIADCKDDIKATEDEYKEWQKNYDDATSSDKADKDVDNDFGDDDDDLNDEVNKNVTPEDIDEYSEHIEDDTTDDTNEFSTETAIDGDLFDTEDGLPDMDAADNFDFSEEDAAEGEPELDFSEEDFASTTDDATLPEDDSFNSEEYDESKFDEDFDKQAENIMDDLVDYAEEDESLPEASGEAELDAAINTNTDEPKVTGVYFDEQLETGKIQPRGHVSIAMPRVSQEGNKYVETLNIPFYLENNSPILDNAELSPEVYQETIDAIKANPSYSEASGESEVFSEIDDYFDGDEADETRTADSDVEDLNLEDEDFSLDLEDAIDLPEAPAYEYDGTEIELPANNIDLGSNEKYLDRKKSLNDQPVAKKDKDTLKESRKIVGIASTVKSRGHLHRVSESSSKRLGKTKKRMNIQ